MASQLIARSEFVKHNVVGDCWIEIDGKVYDVSEWMRRHPGGERVLECLGGKDASLPFLLNHDPSVGRKYLKSMCIGTLEPRPKKGKYDGMTRDFRILYDEFQRKGWFQTSYAYYTKKVAVLLIMLCSVLCLFQWGRRYDRPLLVVIGSVLTGIFWQQIAFIGHDLGHNGCTHSVWLDTAIGFIFGNLGQGISIGWWKYTHNVHHVRTNDAEWDPDIQHMPVIAISTRHLSDLWSKFHRRVMPGSKLCIKYQHFHWFFTVMASRLFLYLSSLIFAVWQQPRHQNGRNEPFRGYNVLEVVTLLLYHFWTLSLFYFGTDSPAIYYLIAYFTAGILHIQIISNHFPCPVVDDIEDDNFVLNQLRTSMAISSNTFSHWFHGGLQFQVEHHLFPMMPRHNLRRVKPYILELAEKYDVPYLENTFFGAVSDIFFVLKDVSEHSELLDMNSYAAMMREQ